MLLKCSRFTYEFIRCAFNGFLYVTLDLIVGMFDLELKRVDVMNVLFINVYVRVRVRLIRILRT